MKINKIYSFLSILVVAFTLNSCVEDGDFSVPDISIKEPNISAKSSITAVKSALIQEFKSNDELMYTFPVLDDNPNDDIDKALYLEAYVVSNDAAGNFYKKLIIQDKAENPEAGIEIILDNSTLGETYEVGRKIYLKLDGLTVSYDDGGNNNNSSPNDDIDPENNVPGKYVLGKLIGDRVDDIPSTEIKDHIFRSAVKKDIVPTVVNILDITGEHVNTMIQISSAQILKEELNNTFAGEPNDQFDGVRTIIECVTEKTIQLQTSTFASFKSNLLPQGKGKFTAVLSKDYFSEQLVTIVNTPSDIEFTDAERCDPKELDCGVTSAHGANILFEDNFETQTTNSPVSGNGWTNFIEEGTKGWEAYSQSGANSSQGISARIGSYRSNESSNIAWLITPEIDLDTNNNVRVSFETSNSFADDSNLKLLFSDDWDGTTAGIATATWGVLPSAYVVQDSDSFSAWFPSGFVNLSCGTGKIHIAFKYIGNGSSDFDGTYELDNIKVSAD